MYMHKFVHVHAQTYMHFSPLPNVACQVLPYLVFLIPTLEEWEQVRIAGKGDKIQKLLFLRVFHTKRTKTSAFLSVRYLILVS
jgi:hypothetical protein